LLNNIHVFCFNYRKYKGTEEEINLGLKKKIVFGIAFGIGVEN